MASIPQLKENRSRAKAKLTSTCRQLISNNNLTVLDNLHTALQQAYTDFLDVHFQFSELVLESSDTSVGTVGGLSLEQYFDNAMKLYGEAIEAFAKQKAEGLALQVEVTVEKANVILQQLQQGNKSAAIFEDAENISFLCSDYYKQLLAVGYKGDLVLQLKACIKDLDVQVLKSRETSDSANFMPSNVRDSESHDLPVTNSVSLSNTSTVRFGESTGHSQPGESGSPARSGGGGLDDQLDVNMSVVSAYAKNTQRLPSILTSSVVPNTVEGDSSVNTPKAKSKFKRSPPPVFSGNRREWAEFRAVWQHYGATEFTDDAQRAWALKGCLKGAALDCVKAIYITQPNAYVRMWQRLDSIYSDISSSVQAAYDDLKKLKHVREDDLKALVKFINEVELCYSQLGEICQINSVTMTHIDELSDLLPFSVRKDWMKAYRELSVEEKIHPFSSFMTFLEAERSVAIRLSERDNRGKSVSHQKTVHQAQVRPSPTEPKTTTVTPVSSSVLSTVSSCLIHNKPPAKHSTEKCSKFISMSVPERVAELRKARACFRCFGLHMRTNCKSSNLCSVCNSDAHHSLLCRDVNVSNTVVDESNKTVSSQSHTKGGYHSDIHSGDTVYPIQQVPVVGSKRRAAVFFDGGSNATFISEQAVRTLKAKRLNKVELNLVTMGNSETSYSTSLYEVKLTQADQSVVSLQAYSIPEIMGRVELLDPQVVKGLFPDFPIDYLPDSPCVDLLIGNDYYGLHPKVELQRAGEHLGMLKGPLGICIQGAHPDLKYGRSQAGSLQAYGSSYHIKSVLQPTHVQFRGEPKAKGKVEAFIMGEELGTEVVPRCGSCKCTKCPVPGHTFSFNEERELDMIRCNLKYDSEGKRWITSYPWISDPADLPNNYSSALATLNSTEKRLKTDSRWAETYKSQVEDMVTREVARKLTPQEILEWDGPIFYISHLAVVSLKSTTTPVRIVFNSSQKFQGVSLNSFLAKGPDNYLNNLLGILLRWREKETVLVSDIRKMYNSVYISPVEQHCHRFLWRDLQDREPDIYVIQRVNMGDKPAGAISTEAVYKTADMFKDQYPDACDLLRRSTYVDDIVHSVDTADQARRLSKEVEYVLGEAGFALKGWTFNGSLLNPDAEVEQLRILGLQWEPKNDLLKYRTRLNFSSKKKGVSPVDNPTLSDDLSCIPRKLTRRLVLEQVMKLYDPLGVLCPFTLQAKILLRRTWELKLGWDEPLPDDLWHQWIKFFEEYLQISDLRYDRCLSPKDKVGMPVLIILSDGSDVAYGASAYIRWELEDGSFWCRLIMAKCRIAPLRRISTPQMELNGAVLSKRVRKVLEQEHRFQFSKVYHLLDSITVLNIINKMSTRFKLYEGVRVGEIQAASDGNMSEWFWVRGQDNIADWVTRCKKPHELGPGSEWWCGPAFLNTPVEQWPIKSHADCQSSSASVLPGEKNPVTKTMVTKVQPDFVDYRRFNSMKKLKWTLARVLRACKLRSFKACTKTITVKDLQAAEIFVIKDAQQEIKEEDTGRKGRYRRLNPTRGPEGIWLVGRRLSECHATTVGPSVPQMLLPPAHPVTHLLMMQAHEQSGHRGRDSTLIRFRQRFWTPKAAKLADSVKKQCQMCKLRDPQLLSPEMGVLPIERLKPGPPFNNTMVDLFGPYSIRGEIQKRVTGKAYGVLFTDMCSRAVHIEGVFSYDTASFIMALTRFVSVRGWPQTFFSDPGTQLVGASNDLADVWKVIKDDELFKLSIENGTTWKFGPADTPWQQGAAEALVRSVKKCFRYTFGDQRISSSEFLTVCAQAASVVNERPLAVLPADDEAISVLTPNCLLIGRPYAQNPGGWRCNTDVRRRLELVEELADSFWKKWASEYLPTLMNQQKWFKGKGDVQVGDVVVVADSNSLRGKYRVAMVREVFPGKDGVVRSVALHYKTFRVGEKIHEYKGGSDVTVLRSVRRLAPLVRVGETDSLDL